VSLYPWKAAAAAMIVIVAAAVAAAAAVCSSIFLLHSGLHYTQTHNRYQLQNRTAL
jgi:hypothetical protein